MRRLTVLAAAIAAASVTACSSQVTPTNPYDPATPPELQAKAALRGTLVTSLLASRANMPVGLRKDGRPQTPTQTDASGFFVFSSLVPGDYQAEIAPTGFVPITIQVKLAPGQELDLGDVGLTPLSGAQGAAIRGRVTLEGGTAELSGTLVEAVGTAFTAVTSSTGDFQLPLIPGSYTLRYSHPTFKPLTAATQVVLASGETYVLPEDVLLYINPAHLAGLVLGETAGGPPAPLSLVDVTVDGHTGLSRTGPSGEYQLDVPAGSYLVRLHKPGYTDVTVPVFDLLGGGLYDLGSATMALARGGLAGRVALADGGDPSGTVVEVTGEGRATVASSDGRFSFDGLLAGRVYEVTARRDGYTRALQGSLNVAEGAVADAGTLTLARQGGTVAIDTPYLNAADRVVQLQLNATGVTHYLASEDAGFADPARGDTLAGSAWRPFVAGTKYPFTLGDADGEHVVYVVFSTGGANPGAPMSATVVLDRVAPEAPAVAVGDGSGWSRTPSGLVSLALSAQDLAPAIGAVASGLDKVQLVNGTTFSGPGLQTLPYNTAAAWTVEPPGGDGLKTISARFIDRAGNVSAPVTTTVTVDTQKPTSPSLALSGPDEGRSGFTTSPIVTAALAAVDPSGGVGNAQLLVKLSNTPGFVGARYQPYAPTLSWVLTPGDGTKTVFAQFMDPAGNESDPVPAQIELKTAGPTAPVLAIDEHDARPTNGSTSVRTVSLRLQAVGGAVTAVVAENPALTGGVSFALAGQPVPYQPDFTLADVDGLHTLWVRYYDEAGNASDLATAAVTLDRAGPSATAPALDPAGWATTTAASLALPAAGQDEVQVDGPGVTPVPWTAAPAGAVVPLTLTAGDGAKSLTVTYRDLADNRSAAIPLALSLDATPPTAADFTVTGALADGSPSTGATTTRVVTLTFAGASDAGSGLAELQLSEDAGLAGAAWQPFASPATFTLSAGDGPKTVHARFRDAAGNTTTAVVTGGITLDTTAPTGGSAALTEQDGRPSNGATNARAVVLTLGAAGAVRAEVAENPSFFGAAAVAGPFPVLTPASGAGAIRLSDADGLHVLWVRFLDAAGNASTPVSAQVVLDRVAPLAVAPTLSATGFVAPATGLTMTLPAAGQDEVQVGGAGVLAAPFAAGPPGAVVPLTLTGADGAKAISVTYRDLADNLSPALPLSVTVDGTPPSAANFTVTGALADGTPSTVTTAARGVTLTFAGVADAGSGVTELQLSEDPALAGAAWQPWAATASFTLSAGDAPKTVYARFRDAVGNVTASAVTGTIALDGTAPTGGTVALAEQDSRATNGYTNSRNVSLTLSASGATRAQVAENPSFFGATTVAGPFPVVTPATGGGAIPLTDVDGLHTVWIRYLDAAGNASTPVFAQVMLDRVAPAANAPALSVTGVVAPATPVSLTIPSAGQDEVQVVGAGVIPVPFTAAPAGAVVPLSLLAGDGAKTIAVTYRDLADNLSAAMPLSVTVDGTPPTAANFAVTGALADGTASTGTTATRSVTLTFAGVADAGAGVTELQLSEAPDLAGAAWQPFAATAAFTLSAGDAPKTVYARFRDAVGNVSAPAVTGAIALDTTAPTGGTLAITEQDSRATNGATNSRNVALTLNAAGATRALVAENPSFVGATTVTGPFPVTTPATGAGSIPLSDADGLHTVWVRYDDAMGNASTPVSALVTLDRVAPTATAPTLSPSGYATSTGATLAMPSAGQDQVQVGGTGVTAVPFTAAPPGAVVPLTLVGGDGAKAITVTYRDLADNQSAPIPLSLTLDTTAPAALPFTVTGQLADGTASATLTATTAVTLNLSGQTDATSGIAEVMLSNDPLFAGAGWQAFVSSDKVPWVLSPGDGTKVVYAQFRDRAGKVSAAVQGAIPLAAAPPTGGTLTIEGGAAATNKSVKNGQTVRLALAATGAAEMQLTVDGVATDWEPAAATKDVLLPWSADGSVVVSVVFRTAARVEGAGAAASILLDTARPVLDKLTLTGTLADSQTSTTHAAGPVVVATSSWKDDPGLTHVAYVEGAACTFGATPAWQPFAPSSTFVLSAGDGDKTVCAVLEDEAGNVSDPQAGSLTLDTVAPPNPVFTNLTSRITNQRTASGTVAALAPDAPPATSVEYQCLGGQYGSTWAACALPPGRTLAFDLLQNQDNQLGVRTRDQAHNVSTGSVVTVTHDGLAPQAPSITSVTTSAGTLTVRWQRSPDGDVDDYQVSYGNSAGDISGTGAAQGASPIAMGSPASTQLVLTGLTLGTPYYVSVQAVDRAGNLSMRSAQRVAVPNVANPRLLGSLGGQPTGVAILPGTGATTWAYLAEHLGLLQVDVSDDLSVPVERARVPLENFEPDTAEPAAVGCTWGRQAGHCVVLAGSSMEGDYRNEPRVHRAPSPVVWFPPDGGPGTPLTLLPSAPFAVAATTIGGVPVVAAVEARAVRFFSLADPTTPLLLASADAPNGGPWSQVDAVDFTGARLVVLADGLTHAYDADAVVVAGTVVDHGPLGPYPQGRATAHQGYVVSDRVVETCDPDTEICNSYEEVLVTEPVSGVVADLSSGTMVDANAPTAFAKGAGTVWAFHGASPFALKIEVGPPGTASAAIHRDANVPVTNALAGVRTGTVATVNGVEHLFQLRSVGGREVMERATGSGAPTFLATTFKEVATDHFAVVGATIYVPDGDLLRAIDAGNPLALRPAGGAGGTPGVTYRDVVATGGLLAATWFRTSAPNWGIDLFWPVRGAAPKFIVALPGTNVDAVTIAGNFVFAGAGNADSLDVWSFTTGASPTATKRVSAALRAAAVALRPEFYSLANVFWVYTVAPGTGRVTVSRFDTGTFAFIANLAFVTLPGLGLNPPITASITGNMLLVSDALATYRVDLGFTSSMVVGATNSGVAGRAVVQGGYLAGLAPVGLPHGPVLATLDGGMVDGALPFSSCGAAGSPSAAAFQAEGALQYASCRRNGLLISTLANPSSGRLFKQYGGVLAPGYGDGVTSWSADFNGKVSRIDEMSNADGSPTPPTTAMDLSGKSAVLATPGWGFSIGTTDIRSWRIQPDGTWSGAGGASLAVVGDWWMPPAQDGRRLYTVRGATDLVAVDITAPWALTSVSGATLADGGTFLQSIGSRLLVGDGATAREYDTTTQPFTLVNGVALGGTVEGLAPAGQALFYTTGATLGVWTPAQPPAFPSATLQPFFTSKVRLSNPVVAGDVLYVLENGTLLAFDLRPYLLDRTRLPVRLTPTSPDGVSTVKTQLWIEGPFAYGIVSSSLADGTYRAYDLR